MLMHFSARLLPLSDIVGVCDRIVGANGVNRILEHIGTVYTWGDNDYSLVALPRFVERLDSCEAVTQDLVAELNSLFDRADFIDLAS